MQKLLIILFLTSSFAFADVALTGAKAGEWTMDIEAAYKLAKEKKLPILINFTGSDWCYWCKIMEKNVFEKEAWKKYAKDNVVMVTIDFPSDKSIVPEKYKSRNKNLAQKFNVRGYPTFILLDHEQTQVGQLGAGRDKTPDSFRKEIEGQIYLSPEGIEKTLKKLSKTDQEIYKKILSKHQKVIENLDKWIETKPGNSEANLKLYKKLLKEIEVVENELAKYW